MYLMHPLVVHAQTLGCTYVAVAERLTCMHDMLSSVPQRIDPYKPMVLFVCSSPVNIPLLSQLLPKRPLPTSRVGMLKIIGGADGELPARAGWCAPGGQRACHGSWRGWRGDGYSSTRDVSTTSICECLTSLQMCVPPKAVVKVATL